MTSSRTTSSSLLIAAAFVVANAAQAQNQSPSIEERLQRLEKQARQERLGVGVADATSTKASWTTLDTPGIPELEDPNVGATVDLKLWGRASMLYSYDNHQSAGGIGGADFTNFVTSEGNDQMNFNPRDTRFGFAASNAWDDWVGRAVGEVDFYGNTAGGLAPRLRLGYVELAHKCGASVRAGLDWNPIAQQHPAMLDFGIMNRSGNLFSQITQLTVRYRKGSWQYLVSLMGNRVGNRQTQQQRVPWVLGRVARRFADGKGLVAFGAGWRSNSQNNGALSVDTDSYMAALEFVIPVCSGCGINGEVWTGTGIGSELLRAGLDYNAVGNEIASTGGFISLRWDLDQQNQVNVGAGIDKPDDSDTTASSFYGTTTPFDQNRSLFVNFRHKLSKQASVGIEFVDMETETVNLGAGSTNLNGQRITLGFWFIF